MNSIERQARASKGRRPLARLAWLAGCACLALTAQGTEMQAAEPKKPAPPVRIDPARVAGAVSGGLRWLAEQQVREGSEAGSWPIGMNRPTCRPAVASLAGMAFLANGYLPGDDSQYGKNVALTVKYVMQSMSRGGQVGVNDPSGMYVHAISTLFALSCLGMQTNETVEAELAEWCRRSLDVIVKAQQVAKSQEYAGGWRYDPFEKESDVSVTCWQLMVLHTARQAGFEVDPHVFGAAQAYLRRAYQQVQADSEKEKGVTLGGYRYRPSQQPESSATALVLFIQSLFNISEPKRTRESLALLRRYSPAWGGPQYNGFFYFASFYMVQGMFQIGGDEWKAFGPRQAAVLLDHQAGDGSWPYPPGNNAEGEWTTTSGPAYPVAMAVLMLSIDKQYLPMYQRQRHFHETGVAPAAATSAEAPTVTKPAPGTELPPATTKLNDPTVTEDPRETPPPLPPPEPPEEPEDPLPGNGRPVYR